MVGWLFVIGFFVLTAVVLVYAVTDTVIKAVRRRRRERREREEWLEKVRRFDLGDSLDRFFREMGE